jgi:hypothetical protein
MTVLGPIMQVAYVVEDLDRAIQHWATKLGVGPFFVLEHVKFDEAWFRDQPCAVDFSVAIGYWGEMQIELIEQHNDAPSIYREFLQKGYRGMQHLCVVAMDMDAELAKLAARGLKKVQWGVVSGSGARFAYVDSDQDPGGMIELIEGIPAILGAFDFMRKAAREWDGKDPVRRF